MKKTKKPFTNEVLERFKTWTQEQEWPINTREMIKKIKKTYNVTEYFQDRITAYLNDFHLTKQKWKNPPQ